MILSDFLPNYLHNRRIAARPGRFGDSCLCGTHKEDAADAARIVKDTKAPHGTHL
jgi:hypothetical protein